MSEGSPVSVRFLLSKIREGVLIETLMMMINGINQRGGQSLKRRLFVIIIRKPVI
jgi:hypothetical protein